MSSSGDRTRSSLRGRFIPLAFHGRLLGPPGWRDPVSLFGRIVPSPEPTTSRMGLAAALHAAQAWSRHTANSVGSNISALDRREEHQSARAWHRCRSPRCRARDAPRESRADRVVGQSAANDEGGSARRRPDAPRTTDSPQLNDDRRGDRGGWTSLPQGTTCVAAGRKTMEIVAATRVTGHRSVTAISRGTATVLSFVVEHALACRIPHACGVARPWRFTIPGSAPANGRNPSFSASAAPYPVLIDIRRLRLSTPNSGRSCVSRGPGRIAAMAAFHILDRASSGRSLRGSARVTNASETRPRLLRGLEPRRRARGVVHARLECAKVHQSLVM